MSPLRRRMIDDMQIRNLTPNTQHVYVAQVVRFASARRTAGGTISPPWAGRKRLLPAPATNLSRGGQGSRWCRHRGASRSGSRPVTRRGCVSHRPTRPVSCSRHP
jgi:hypothetical protein